MDNRCYPRAQQRAAGQLTALAGRTQSTSATAGAPPWRTLHNRAGHPTKIEYRASQRAEAMDVDHSEVAPTQEATGDRRSS